jgi:hypothetical protein
MEGVSASVRTERHPDPDASGDSGSPNYMNLPNWSVIPQGSFSANTSLIACRT